MKFLALTAALAALASLTSAAPTALSKRDEVKPAYIGQLVEYSTSVPIGGSLSVAYNTAPPYEPHYGASIRAVDIGLQGPGPIVVDPQSFTPYGILELANGLETGGPGGWVNSTVTLPRAVYQAGEYFLIVTEHQVPVYDSEQPFYRVQSYNVSIQVTEAAA
ncbi:hypothetical protein JCM10450v2_000546 [Rhodotorula kratochvilovae]